MNLISTVLSVICKFFAVLGISLGTLIVFMNVILRYFFNSGLSFASELSNTLFVWSAFFAMAYGFHKNAHISIKTINSKFVTLIANLISIVFLFSISYSSINYLYIMYEIDQRNVELFLVPQYIPMLVLPITFLIASIFILFNVRRGDCQ